MSPYEKFWWYIILDRTCLSLPLSPTGAPKKVERLHADWNTSRPLAYDWRRCMREAGGMRRPGVHWIWNRAWCHVKTCNERQKESGCRVDQGTLKPFGVRSVQSTLKRWWLNTLKTDKDVSAIGLSLDKFYGAHNHRPKNALLYLCSACKDW